MADSFEMGEVVYATDALYNDGGLPELPEDALIAAPGARGVVVQVGHAEEAPSETIYLVRFEGANDLLGPPVGCLPEELTQDEELARSLRAATV